VARGSTDKEPPIKQVRQKKMSDCHNGIGLICSAIPFLMVFRFLRI